MTYYDDIYDHAVDEYFLITTTEAKSIGVPPIELVKLAHRGKLERVGQGVYRVTRYIPSENDSYAEAVKLVGEGAVLYGESVIALLGLSPTNPTRIFVASPNRIRKTLPSYLTVVSLPREKCNSERYYGIPCQKLVDAIAACVGTMMPERLETAIETAWHQGYLNAEEHLHLRGVLHGCDRETEKG